MASSTQPILPENNREERRVPLNRSHLCAGFVREERRVLLALYRVERRVPAPASIATLHRHSVHTFSQYKWVSAINAHPNKAKKNSAMPMTTYNRVRLRAV